MSQQGMPNLVELYQNAAQGFRKTLLEVKADQMGNATPCSLWNVQQLIKHNINVTGFVREVFAGNVNVNPMDVSGPLPSNGAVEALDGGVDGVLKLATAPGALENELATPFGPMPGGQFFVNPIVDLLIHRWDLAKGSSQDTKLDGDLVEFIYNAVSPHMDDIRKVEMAGVPIFAAAVSVPDSASTQDKLLGMLGRKP